VGGFGIGASQSDKPKGVSLVVNQIDKRARKRMPKVLFVMIVAASMTAAGAWAVQWAAKSDDASVPTIDEFFGDDAGENPDQGGRSAEQNLADYDVVLVMTAKLTNQGDHADRNVRWSLVGQDFKLDKDGFADVSQPEKLWYKDDRLGGKGMCEDGLVFDNTMTLYFPDGKQTDGLYFCHSVNKDDTGNTYRILFYARPHGFGEYRYKGVFIDGDVNYCNWGFSKCWKYYERYYDASFQLKKDGGGSWF
jgi:hypothetical protein